MTRPRTTTALALLSVAAFAAVPTSDGVAEVPSTLELPWREAGLSERQAAAHLLDRFAYGARPGEVDRVVEIGLESWLERQLRAAEGERELERRLDDFTSLELSNREILETYPAPAMVQRQAVEAGVISRDDLPSGEEMDGDRGPEERRRRAELVRWFEQQGYRPQRELLGETMSQKLLRAVYAENQLREVLTDFWFNHFNVSITDPETRPFVLGYERDAIRPHVLGSFPAMLGATARHPAMLLYLDNTRSVADKGRPTTFERDRFERRPDRDRRNRGRFAGRRGRAGARERGGPATDPERRARLEERGPQGLNENYARELLELHTLGVDGGYSQQDVVEVARAFTGWSVLPPQAEERYGRMIDLARRRPQLGFEFGDTFVFRADVHDAGRKTVLGTTLPAGRGIEDGEDVLRLLAGHPETARHLATKLAVRFVSDQPPAALVDRLAATYLATRGDLGAMVRTLAESPELWASRGEKIKTPFELVVSSLRATGAEVEAPRALVEWVAAIGQPLYGYAAPTGYSDTADAWVNTGALLQRMNYGMFLATGRVPGVALDLPALAGGREPESREDALATYLPLLLPERDAAETLRRLEPLVRDPELVAKLDERAPEASAAVLEDDEWAFEPTMAERARGRRGRFGGDRFGPGRDDLPRETDASAVAQVVGIVLGSPEFQRR